MQPQNVRAGSSSRPRGSSYAVPLGVATVLGTTHALVSVFWLFSTAGLDTVGGAIEDWGRRGGPLVTAVLLVVVAAKLLVVGLGLAAARGRRGVPRAAAWLAGVVLLGYGAVNTVAAQLMLADVVAPPADVDRPALVAHAWVWDPWFALWGAALLLVLRRTRPHAR